MVVLSGRLEIGDKELRHWNSYMDVCMYVFLYTQEILKRGGCRCKIAGGSVFFLFVFVGRSKGRVPWPLAYFRVVRVLRYIVG